MSRVLPVALALVVTTFLSAAPVRLGLEHPLGVPQLGAAASEQYSPSAAWNGRTGLMAWIDGRGRYPADSVWKRHEATRYLRVSPMRADGSLVNPNGMPLVPASFVRIASNGSSFLAVYGDIDGVHALPLDENGAAAGSPLPLTGFFNYDFELLSNGHSFLFVMRGGASIVWSLLAPSGITTGSGELSTGSMAAQAAAATTARNDYVIAYRTAPCPSLPCGPDIHLAKIQDDGMVVINKQIVHDTDTGAGLALASSDDRLLLEIIGWGDARTMVMDLDGNVLSPLRQIVQKQMAVEGPQAAYWDGENFLVTWPAAPAANQSFFAKQVEAMRVSPANAIVDATPIALADTAPLELSFTRTGAQTVMLWYSLYDVVRRSFTSTAELFTQPLQKETAVLSIRPQSQLALAPNGSETIRVWREGSSDSHIMLSTGRNTVEVASSRDRELLDPSVARGGNTILVFWRDIDKPAPSQTLSTAGYRTYARRFAASGSAIDAQPLLIFKSDEYVDTELGTATAYDGRNFIVFWSGSAWDGNSTQPTIRARRISPAGEILDTAPVFVPAPQEYGVSTGLRATWTGREMLVAWSTWNDYRGVLISPPPPPRSALDVVRLDTSTMQVLDSRTIWNDAGLSKKLDLSWNGTNALLTSLHSGCVEATLIDASLKTVQNRGNIECAAFPFIANPSGSWNGSEFVLAWAVNHTDGDMIRGLRLDRALQPLDDAPLDIIAGYDPVLMGTELAYVRIDPDVPRGFFRTIERLAAPSRGRAAGH